PHPRGRPPSPPRRSSDLKQAYHGSTQGALSVIGNKAYHEAYAPLLPEIDFITFNDISSLSRITTETAAVIMETVQGEAGVRVPRSEEHTSELQSRENLVC